MFTSGDQRGTVHVCFGVHSMVIACGRRDSMLTQSTDHGKHAYIIHEDFAWQ